MRSSGLHENYSDTFDRRRVSEALTIVLALPKEMRTAELDRLGIKGADRREVESLLQFETCAGEISNVCSPITDAVLSELAESSSGNDIRIPGFTLEEVIGQGATGVVYAARQENPGRQVAVKVLRVLCAGSGEADRFQLEAHLAARLEHPNIGRVYQVGMVKNSIMSLPYIVMEYINGRPLSQMLTDEQLSYDDRMNIVLQVCRAVEYSHSIGVIHRDIKPSNVMVSPGQYENEYLAKVIDFGIAKLINDEDTPIKVQTVNSRMLGTMRYMSPERRDGTDSGTAVASDMYSLGVLTCETLAGRKVAGKQSKGTHEVGDVLEELGIDLLPVAIQLVIRRMTNPNPAKRYSSVNEARECLLAAPRINGFTHAASRVKLKVHDTALVGNLNLHIAIPCVAVVFIVVVWKLMLSWNTGAAAANGQSDVHGQLSVVDQQADSETLTVPGIVIDTQRKKLWDYINEKSLTATELSGIGQHEEAIGIARTLWEESGDMERGQRLTTLSNLAYIVVRAGQHEEGERLLRQLISMIELADPGDRTDWNCWLNSAASLRKIGYAEEAKQMYVDAVEHPGLDSQNWHIRTNGYAALAGIYWLEQSYEEAEALFRKSLLGSPWFSNTARTQMDIATRESSLGLVLVSLGRFQEAKELQSLAVERAVGIYGASHHECARLSLNLAYTHYLSGDIDRAEELALFSQTVWSTNPENWNSELASVSCILGSVEIKRENYGLAIDHLRYALSLFNPEQVDLDRLHTRIMDALGAALVMYGAVEEGQSLLQVSNVQIKQFYGPEHPFVQLSNERFESLSALDQ